MLFLVVIFLLKNTSIFKNVETYQNGNQENGLSYSNVTIKDLVSKDTDGDGIPDWEESLYGLDPTKKETTPGIPDSVAIEKLKSAQANATDATKGTTPTTENLTKTDQFSRELFATIAAANQNGTMDQATIDALGAALSDKIQNPVVRKVFLISDIKISTNDDHQAIKNYASALNKIQKLYTTNYTVLDVLQKFIADPNNVDISILVKLDPIIAQTNEIIDAMIKTSVPKSLSVAHLDVINALERLVENITDMKLFDSDIVVALSAVTQYEKNGTLLESATEKLHTEINKN